MSSWQFYSALWTLTLLRRDELIAWGLIDDSEDAWEKYRADPFGWAMMNPGKSDRLWRAICQHDPRSQSERTNVVEFPNQSGTTGAG